MPSRSFVGVSSRESTLMASFNTSKGQPGLRKLNKVRIFVTEGHSCLDHSQSITKGYFHQVFIGRLLFLPTRYMFFVFKYSCLPYLYTSRSRRPPGAVPRGKICSVFSKVFPHFNQSSDQQERMMKCDSFDQMLLTCLPPMIEPHSPVSRNPPKRVGGNRPASHYT